MPGAAKVADVIVASKNNDEICLEKVRLESKMKPRLLAESVGVIADLKELREKG